jgi:hypothetical protein
MPLGDYMRDGLLNESFGGTTFTFPGTHHIGLKTANPTADNSGGTEPTATGSYARESVVNNTTNWGTDTSNGTKANAVAITFTESTAAWSTGATPLTYFIALDSATLGSGNFLWYGPLDTSRTVNAAGITLEFAIGELDITYA